LNKADTTPESSLESVEGVRGAIFGGRRPIHLQRYAVAPDLQPYVRNAWFIDWDLGPQGQHMQGVLAPPAVNISVQPDQDGITGVQTVADARHLRGRSWVRGLLFRPAGFAALVGPCLHAWVDRREPIAQVLAPVEALREAFRATSDPAEQLAAYQDWLRPQLRPIDEGRRQLAEDVVELIRTDRSLLDVATLVQRTGRSERTLQRLLRAWVGLSPKVLIRRYRLHEAMHLLTQHPNTDLAELAYRLGYADQAHFSRDFSRVLGEPPAAYVRRCQDRADHPARRPEPS